MNETTYFQLELQRELARRVDSNPRYSARAFAKALGINDGALSQIMSGKRTPTLKLGERLVRALQLSQRDSARFMRSLQTLRHVRQGLPKVQIKSSVQVPVVALREEQQVILSSWYHVALLELVSLQQFKADPVWTARALGISTSQAQVAWRRLKQCQLVREVEPGKFVKCEGNLATLNRGETTASLRRLQRELLHKSEESLVNDPIDERSHTSMTMAIDPALLPMVKDIIEKFAQSMCSALEVESKSRVYNLQVALYPLQEKVK